MSNAAARKHSDVKAQKEPPRAVQSGSGSESETANPLWQNMIMRGMDAPYIQRKCESCEEEDKQVQTKLNVGLPNDHYEREADAIADEIMHQPFGHSVDTITPIGSRKIIEKKESTLSKNAIPPSNNLSIYVNDLNGKGEALSKSENQFFSSRFGRTFDSVRLHNGNEANQAAKGINAKAFTYGNHIVFNQGAYQPNTPESNHLLAHELTHVVQQQSHSGKNNIQRDPLTDSAIQSDDFQFGGVLPATESQQPEEESQQLEPSLPMSSRHRGDFFHFGTYQTGYYKIVDDELYMRYEMTRLISNKGLSEAKYWMKLLVSRQGREIDDMPRAFSAHTMATRRGVRSAIDMRNEMNRDTLRQQVAPHAIPTAQRMFNEVYAQAEAYLRQFESKAKDVTRVLLQTSEDKVKAEAARYGLSNPSFLVYTMEQGGDSSGLVGAAQDLREKQQEIVNLESQRDSLYEIRTISYWSGITQRFLPQENETRHREIIENIRQIQTEYQVLSHIYEQRYPILASFANQQDEIARIAVADSNSVALLLQLDVNKKLTNIEKVRGGLSSGKVKIWKLPEIITLTKLATQDSENPVTNAMYSKVVEDKRNEILRDELFTNLAIAALAIGLAVLAAIPSGGSSLVAGAAALASLGSLGLSIHLASEGINNYTLEKAMTGTDFDRAKAISNDDPSLFWLALDIVGVLLDLGPAVRATRSMITSARTAYTSLAPLARRALTAQGDEIAESLSLIRRTAQSDELAETVIRSIDKMRGGADAQQLIGRAAGHEAAARSVLRTSDSVGETASTVIGSHTVRVAPGSGALIICSECTWARGMFANELASNSQFMSRLEDLEEAGRLAAQTDDAASATRVAVQTKVLADEMLAMRRARLHASARALTSDEIVEFSRLRSLEPAQMGRNEIEQLQSLREASGEAFSGRLIANTPDHKAERWLEYLSRGGQWEYDHWGRMYQQNMTRATRSHQAVEAFRTSVLGWGETQVVTRPFGDNGARRILDIAEETVDPLTGTRRLIRAVEHKEGYITMSDAIRAEIRADKQLLRNGADISWFIDGRASQGLRDALAAPPPIRLVETTPTMPIRDIRGG